MQTAARPEAEARRMLSIIQKYVKYQTGIPLKSKGVVIHETAAPGDTAQSEWDWVNRNWNNSDGHVYAHRYIDTKQILQFAPLDQECYHAMSPANEMFIGWEMCSAANAADFLIIYENTCEGVADYLKSIGIKTVTTANVMSHHEVSNKWHKSDHVDPDDYLAKYGKNIDMMRQRIQQYIDGQAAVTVIAPMATHTTIKKGSTGADVTTLQTRLNALGYNCGIVDGDFGAKTDAATRAFQTAQKLEVDGIVGPMTWLALTGSTITPPVVYPQTVLLSGMPAIIANDIVVASPHTGVRYFENSMTGGFNNGAGPCSICVIDGKVICGTACHSTYGCPETVIYRTCDGVIGIKRVMSVDELPGNLWWAVGGLGLGSAYNPNAEGFKLMSDGKNFSDVIRDTDHCMLGVKNGYFYLVYCASMTGAQVNAFAVTLGLEMAIMLDGGGWAAINGSESFAQKNLDHIQLFMVQGV